MGTNQNKVFLSRRGIVEIQVIGDQTVKSVQAMGDEAFRLCREQQSAGKPALILDNLLQIGNVPPEGRKLVVELVKSNQYDKLAMVGSSPLIRFGANLMLHATGKGAQVRYFDNYDAAEAWLLENVS